MKYGARLGFVPINSVNIQTHSMFPNTVVHVPVTLVVPGTYYSSRCADAEVSLEILPRHLAGPAYWGHYHMILLRKTSRLYTAVHTPAHTPTNGQAWRVSSPYGILYWYEKKSKVLVA